MDGNSITFFPSNFLLLLLFWSFSIREAILMEDWKFVYITYFVLVPKCEKLAKKKKGKGSSHHLCWETNNVALITLRGSPLHANVVFRGSSKEQALYVTCRASFFKREIQSRSRVWWVLHVIVADNLGCKTL